MFMCMQDAFTLAVGLAFWYEKKLFFKEEFEAETNPNTTKKMVKPSENNKNQKKD